MTMRIATFNVSSMALRLFFWRFWKAPEWMLRLCRKHESLRCRCLDTSGLASALAGAASTEDHRPMPPGSHTRGSPSSLDGPLARIKVAPVYGLDDARTLVARVHRPAPARPFNLLGVYLPSGYCAHAMRSGMIDKILNWIPSHGDDCMAIGDWNEELGKSEVGAAVATGLLRSCDEVAAEPPRRRIGGRAMAKCFREVSSTGPLQLRASNARPGARKQASWTTTSFSMTLRSTTPCRRSSCGLRS